MELKRHPLVFGLLLFAGAALVFFVVVFAQARFSGGSALFDQKIALVKIEGVILDAREAIDEIRKFGASPSVRAIVLRIDSPGGGVVPSQEIYEEVRRLRRERNKTVVTSMGSVAASGGYYIAAATERIVANPGTLTGSIGVIMESANVRGLMDKIGVESVVIKSGRNKDIGSPFREMQPEERALLQHVLDDVHAQFITAVADGRKLSESQVRELADGRIFTGRQAQEAGLVDELGNLQDTIQIAADMVGIRGEPRVIETHKAFSLVDLVRNQFAGILPAAKLPEFGISLKYLMTF